MKKNSCYINNTDETWKYNKAPEGKKNHKRMYTE